MTLADLIDKKIDKRIDDTNEWLKANCPQVFVEQKHLDTNSSERFYWHYGYLMALKDLKGLLIQEISN